MIGAEPSLDVTRLRRELAELSAKIETTMHEVARIRHPMMEDDRVRSAVDELGTIVAATEVATEQILDAAERLEGLASRAGADGDPALGGAITDQVTRVYEACNFQDITGQRLDKVMALLREIDRRLMAIIERIGPEAFAAVPPPPAKGGDARLLNGPAPPNGGLGQSSIDALFA